MCVRVHAVFEGSAEYPTKNKYEGEVESIV